MGAVVRVYEQLGPVASGSVSGPVDATRTTPTQHENLWAGDSRSCDEIRRAGLHRRHRQGHSLRYLPAPPYDDFDEELPRAEGA